MLIEKWPVHRWIVHNTGVPDSIPLAIQKHMAAWHALLSCPTIWYVRIAIPVHGGYFIASGLLTLLFISIHVIKEVLTLQA